ncbi:hypothetical protein K469DRAFT_649927 [Zopfia rhizophila CBS 207.26]|uniref:CBF1-interacting co-repressor CIR N-terminal domain-containing protein n=1 Tax=Zopfia rhizophila CBS 207.26 TaxID=1314779 RepID=A0A6A6EY75_9PEZI|nr:hypothetical protein K469DRAFT_649927 [Zopfia rhizophila CBS 207.26]
MPLHLLGKKSWNVYNADNITRVKADEAAAAAREAADEQRMQELDAERRASILRGRTPPPFPEEESKDEERSRRSDRSGFGHDRKRRRLAGEDDTDRDIRLAKEVTAPREENDAATLKLRRPTSDAPLTDHAGNINLFPVDAKATMQREKNAEAEKEKQKKEREFEDQYTMRFSNAAGKGGLERPWYAASASSNVMEGEDPKSGVNLLEYPGFENKDVWGNKDLRRKEREQARLSTSDPLAFMKKAQVQLKQSQKDKKKWAEERDRELRELRAAREREDRRERHGKRKKHAEEDDFDGFSLDTPERHERRNREKHRSSRCHHRSRSQSREQRYDRRPSHLHEHRHGRSGSRDRDKIPHVDRSRERERSKEKTPHHSSSRHGDSRKTYEECRAVFEGR